MNTSKVAMVIALIALVLGGIAMFNIGSTASVGGQFSENVHKTFWRGISIGDERQTIVDREGCISFPGSNGTTMYLTASSTAGTVAATSTKPSTCEQ